ncbi:nuclear factor of activated T-cells 5-like [Oppia nitens]|uniref:nuclear factor of activated T-cells 5-like n=1 Tax=Oppia nitens TaxID=1686743 RepID=UPI0023DCBEB5|nr:nuclear factor of activated T-cells 5-like [Oppia nitens]
MGKSGKRKHELLDTTTLSSSSAITCNSNNHFLDSTVSTHIDEDSGFCGSNLSPNGHKMVKFDDEMFLLKALMKVDESTSDEMVVTNTNTAATDAVVTPAAPPSKFVPFKAQNLSAKSKNGKYELKILSQPEEQHRARYMTEGSRGAIKDRSGLSHPVVKLCGYTKGGPVKVQCFIGHDKHLGASHLFYQASKITGKNSTRCTTKRVDGTVVVFMDASPHNDMQVTVDCVGILKERNVDVEQKLNQLKDRTDEQNCVTIATKKRSTRCRLVFRAQIPDTNEILQVVSSPILCTQPLGTPEVCKKSLAQCDIKGGNELFIIGKNFLKDAKVVWKGRNWTKMVEPDKEFLHPTHLVCVIPCYDGPDKTESLIEVTLSVKSGGKYSEAHKFTYINSEKVNAMTLINGTTAQIGSALPSGQQILLSSIDKPIILTMIGSTSTLTSTLEPQMPTPQDILPQTLTTDQLPINEMKSDTICFSNETPMNVQMTPETIVSVIAEDSLMCNSIMDTSSQSAASATTQLVQSYSPINAMTLPETAIVNQINSETIDQTVYKNDTMNEIQSTPGIITSQPLSLPQQPVSHYLPIKTFATIESSNSQIANTTKTSPMQDMASISDTTISPIQDMASIANNMTTIMGAIQTSMTTTSQPLMQPVVSTINSLPLMTTPIDPKASSDGQQQPPKSDATTIGLINSIQNPVLTSSASTNVTQASNISALSEMSDAELLCFINPATFDQI